MDINTVTTETLMKFRDSAIACARAMGRFVLEYSQPLADGLPLDNLQTQLQRASQELQDLEDLLGEWDRCAAPQLIQALVLVNSDSCSEPVFDNYYFSTHHEAARAAAEMAYLTLAVLTEDLPELEPDLTRLAAISRYELIEFHKQHGDFAPDRTVQRIIGETANAVRYLAAHPDLAELTQLPELRTGSVSKESAPESSDPDMEARNRWVYEQSLLPDKSWNDLRIELAAMPFKSRIITTVGGIRKIAFTYASLHGSPKPPRRKSGRRPGN